MNTLFYGDNLLVLRDHFKDESVDLVYLDPPFNSKRLYNVYLKTPKGHASEAQSTAFEDSWTWGEQAEVEYANLLHQPNTNVAEVITALRNVLKETDLMAYLVMMSSRLLELHRVLKPTGSLYLHCDPTASHYLKVVMDAIFGVENIGNEIVWQRTNAKGLAFTRFANNHDVILRYTKSNHWIWNAQYSPHDPRYVEEFYKYADPGTGRRYALDNLANPNKDRPNLTYEFLDVTRVWRWTKERMQAAYEKGLIVQSAPGAVPRLKRYLDEQEGNPVGDTWVDIPPISSQSGESLGYPTQKPLALLERIIEASSNPGDVVLDPFCGCGTAVHAAQKLGRQWAGIDITHLAISLIEKRLHDAFPGIEFRVHGAPEDLEGARDLASRDKYEFQYWACDLVGAQPYQGKKKGADSGIDGLIFFQDEQSPAKKIIVSVKGGENVGRTMLADLKNSVERESAQMGLFVTLTAPTEPMVKEAVSAGFYDSPFGAFPKIQILTIEGLLSGQEGPRYPDMARGGLNFKKAKKEKGGNQMGLFGA
jgi:site-specific DNA-methyltransferase (adenine-specific)